MEESEAQFDAMTEKLVAQELRIHTRVIEDLKTKYEDLEFKHRVTIDENAKLRNRADIVNDKYETAIDDLAATKSALETAETEVRRLRRELEVLRATTVETSRVAEIERDNTDLRSLVARLEKRLAKAEALVDAQEREVADLRTKSQAVTVTAAESSFSSSAGKENNACRSFCDASQDECKQLHFQVGNLTATNQALQTEITRLKADRAEIEQTMKDLREEVEESKRMTSVLQSRLTESEGASDFSSKAWSDELRRVKAQKTELRIEHIRLKKEFDKFKAEGGHSEELEALKKKLHECENSLADAKNKADEAESAKSLLADEKAKLEDRMQKAEKVTQILDKQCEDYVGIIRKCKESNTLLKTKVAKIERENNDLRSADSDRNALQQEIASLKQANTRLSDKVSYLENEIRETHSDHREELAKLAKQVSTSRQSTPPRQETDLDREQLTQRITHLESIIRQHESVIRSLNRRVDQSKAEVASAEASMASMRHKQCDIVNENTELRQKIAQEEARVRSLSEKHDSLRRERDTMDEELEKLTAEKISLREQVADLQEKLEQKNQNIEYLQCIQQPKKIDRARAQSSLVSDTASSESSAASDDRGEIAELEKQRDALKRLYSQKAKELNEERDKVLPLLKASSMTGSQASQSEEDLIASPTTGRVKAPVGTMRHDIPHRWTKSLNVVVSPSCDVCCDAISRFSQSLKCKLCNIVIHPHCQPKVRNTCGLPPACANFYVDNQSRPGPGKMSGWVKYWRSDSAHGKWADAFASLSETSMSFYNTELANPVTIDLSQERWRIYNQSGSVAGIDADNMDCVIEIKFQNVSFFMLTKSPEAKRHWIHALQQVTEKKILDRNASHKRIAHISPVLTLDKPLLKFQCTEVFDDWLLIGTPQGLFVTSLTNPRMPFQISGFSNVFQLKLLLQSNLLFAINGDDRHVIMVHTNQLRAAISDPRSTSVVPTTLLTDAAHILEVSSAACDDLYMYMATTEGIAVFKHVVKRDVFMPHCTIPTDMPVMSIVTWPGGFTFVTDDTYFHVANGKWTPTAFRSDWPPDTPISVVKISDEEVLVVNYNTGVFTSPQGKRTRPGYVEWERVPLSVTYLEPYLFIVYSDMVSIGRVRSRDDPEAANSPVEEVESYRAPGARVTGQGRHPGEVFVSVSNNVCTELNSFVVSKTHLKRKTAAHSTTSLTAQPSKKRL